MMVMITYLHYITKCECLQNRVQGESVLLLVLQTLSSTTSLTDTQFYYQSHRHSVQANIFVIHVVTKRIRKSAAAKIFHRPFRLIICHRGCTFYYGYQYKPIPGQLKIAFVLTSTFMFTHLILMIHELHLTHILWFCVCQFYKRMLIK